MFQDGSDEAIWPPTTKVHVCTILPNDRKHFRRTARSPPWSTSCQEEGASLSEEKHAPFASAPSELVSPQAITARTEVPAYLPECHIAQTEQLLTRSDEKCDEHNTEPNSDGPFGSVRRKSSATIA